MQHHRNASSRRTPPPDIVRSSRTTTAGPLALPTRPAYEFLIIGLFALRLTKRMIEGLEYYPRRDNDIVWLTKFLAPYSHELALAKIYGLRKEDYIATYQDIISRMKRQPRYPLRFMQMNPDHCTRQQQNSRMSERKTSTEMTDVERLDIIDFCDAAREWGSIVPIPAKEAERMLELADQRRIADLDNRRPTRDDSRDYDER